ncbi:MAG: hypothetical protein ACYC63_20675 [Armatimonadota bacterium]
MSAVRATMTDELAAACDGGADLEDLLQIMRDHGHVELNSDGAPEIVLVDADTTEEKRAPLRSIMARAGGSVPKGKLIAEWLLKMRAGQLEDQDAAADHAAALVASAHDWHDRQKERAAKKIAWIDGLLEWFLRDAGVAKMELVGGKPTLTPTKAHKVWDEKAALQWGLALPDPDTATKRVLDKTKINALIKEAEGDFFDADSGEKLDFVTMVQPEFPDAFSVK